MIYTETYRVRWHDTDANRIVRPSQLLVYMQETANLQMETYGPSLSHMRDVEKKGFILSKLKMDIFAPLHAFDEIAVQAWTCQCRGYSFHRCFRILRNGEVIAQAFSIWALVDIENRSLIRREHFQYGFEDDEPLDMSLPRRLAIPSQLSLLGTRRIRYSDLDYNMHMNNTHYPDMLCDFMPIEETSRIRSMTLSFLQEAPFDSTMAVFGAAADHTRYFRTVNAEGKSCLEAEIVLGE